MFDVQTQSRGTFKLPVSLISFYLRARETMVEAHIQAGWAVDDLQPSDRIDRHRLCRFTVRVVHIINRSWAPWHASSETIPRMRGSDSRLAASRQRLFERQCERKKHRARLLRRRAAGAVAEATRRRFSVETIACLHDDPGSGRGSSEQVRLSQNQEVDSVVRSAVG